MVYAAFSGQLATFDGAAASVARRGGAGQAFNLSVDQLVFQAVDFVRALGAAEALMMVASVVSSNVGGIFRKRHSASGTVVGAIPTVGASVGSGRRLVHGLLVGSVSARWRRVAWLAHRLNRLLDHVSKLGVELVGALWFRHVRLGRGDWVSVGIEGLFVNLGHSRINSHLEIYC
jgi:hypothetical protein